MPPLRVIKRDAAPFYERYTYDAAPAICRHDARRRAAMRWRLPHMAPYGEWYHCHFLDCYAIRAAAAHAGFRLSLATLTGDDAHAGNMPLPRFRLRQVVSATNMEDINITLTKNGRIHDLG